MSNTAIADRSAEREEWLALVNSFCTEVAGWAAGQGWDVTWKSVERTEEALGTYEAPMLIIQTPRRALMVEPVALEVMGAAGRIDLYAYPTLFRVMLLRSPRNEEWRIRTDSGIFLDKPWNRETFVRLATDLTDAG